MSVGRMANWNACNQVQRAFSRRRGRWLKWQSCGDMAWTPEG